jgi:hypothetical protein
MKERDTIHETYISTNTADLYGKSSYLRISDMVTQLPKFQA